MLLHTRSEREISNNDIARPLPMPRKLITIYKTKNRLPFTLTVPTETMADTQD